MKRRSPSERLKGLFSAAIVFSLIVAVGCSSKKFSSKEQSTLAQRLAPTTLWRNYAPSKKSDLVFTALINKLETGYNQLIKGDYRDSYYTFDSILSDPKYAKYEEYLYSKFYLAYSLYYMDINYGALVYLIDILKKEEEKPYLEEALKLAINISQKIKDDSLILYLATILTPDRIAKNLREEFRFFIAKNFYLANTFENSKILFSNIKPENRLYLLSQYYMGVTAVQEDDYKKALKHFGTIIGIEGPEKYYEWEYLLDMANLNIARILFEVGQYQKSVEYYSEVSKESAVYPEALYESSWALYNWGKFNAALSTLHSLQSPFYEITYFPRSILLKGAIFLELCMYKEAVITLKNLEGTYSELKNLMDSFYGQAKSRTDYYTLLTGPENIRADSVENPYKKLFQLASANRDFLQMHRFVKKLNSELKTLSKLSDNKRALYLANHIQSKRKVVTKKAIDLAIEKIELTKRTILDYLRSADVVRLEIITAERKLLEDKLKGYGKEDSTNINIPSPIQSSVFIQDKYEFWKFSGEYWKDEIGNYLYNIESQCVAKDAR